MKIKALKINTQDLFKLGFSQNSNFIFAIQKLNADHIFDAFKNRKKFDFVITQNILHENLYSKNYYQEVFFSNNNEEVKNKAFELIFQEIQKMIDEMSFVCKTIKENKENRSFFSHLIKNVNGESDCEMKMLKKYQDTIDLLKTIKIENLNSMVNFIFNKESDDKEYFVPENFNELLNIEKVYTTYIKHNEVGVSEGKVEKKVISTINNEIEICFTIKNDLDEKDGFVKLANDKYILSNNFVGQEVFMKESDAFEYLNEKLKEFKEMLNVQQNKTLKIENE